MYFVKDSCPVCRTGMLGIRRCADGKTLVVMCEECEAVWVSPELISISNALDAAPPTFEVTEIRIAIASGAAGWSNHEEIVAKGWEKHISGELR